MIALALDVALGCVVVAALLCAIRLLLGPTFSDRILALDTLVVNTIALIVIYGMREGGAIFFEAALLLAMVGFVSTVAYCKFLLRGNITE